MAQLLALAAARRSGLPQVRTFSGGTEATAFNPRAIDALRRVGFAIEPTDGAAGTNPHQRVRLSSALEPVEVYSKRFTDPPNPSSGFVVVMTCSQADAACPVVQGATARIAIPYDDPKVADGTPEEAARYDERVAQIGRDMASVFAAVARRTRP
jgi:arsenate reductase